jgi:flagellar protein FliJ
MHKFNSLQLAIDLAVAKRDQALADLQKLRKSHAFANSQMAQLEQYAVETEQRWTRNAQVSTTPELLHHHYQFMARLQQAISMQTTVISGSRRTVQLAERRMLQAEFRLASLKLVLTHRMAEVDKLKARQEQKLTDEFAAMQTLRQRRAHMENNHGH